MMNDTYNYLDKKYGKDMLALKFFEECAEFSQAYLHLPKTGDYEKFYDELSDLLIVVDRIIHSFECQNEVSTYKIKNMLELKERVSSGKL